MTTSFSPPSPAFPPAVTSAVRAAALEFFSASCRMQVAERSGERSEEQTSGIMGVISFFGEPVWSFALVMPEATAVAAAKAFAGFDIPFDSPDMGDMVGEMANVVAGDVVARLEASRIKVQMALPTVARGHDVELLPPSNVCEARLNFAGPTGGFQLRLFQALVGAAAGRHAVV